MSDCYPWSELEMTVTWGDCDAAGISYYARYFDWFTNGRFHLLEKYGFPYLTTFHNNGIWLVSLTASCQYKKILRPEEKVVLHTCLAGFKRTRMVFTYRIMKSDGQLAAEGETAHAIVDAEGHPFNLERRFPELWRKMADRLGSPENCSG